MSTAESDQTIAVGSGWFAAPHWSVMILALDNVDESIRLRDHRGAEFSAVSHLGWWIVTSTGTTSSVKIRDARTGRLAKEFPAEDGAGVLCRIQEDPPESPERG